MRLIFVADVGDNPHSCNRQASVSELQRRAPLFKRSEKEAPSLCGHRPNVIAKIGPQKIFLDHFESCPVHRPLPMRTIVRSSPAPMVVFGEDMLELLIYSILYIPGTCATLMV